MKIIYILVLILWSHLILAGVLSGKVMESSGQVLPFTSIYKKGTSIGTTSNIDGTYQFTLPAGEHTITFQYIGFESKDITITMTKDDMELDVTLEPYTKSITEIVITAGEDPAYRIIRKAIRRRIFYKDQVKRFQCNSYMKGTQHVQNIPSEIMGRSLSFIRERLDSTGSGIIYLSESLSTIYVDGKKKKEIMNSSKVSGNDNGFSFNSGAALYDISFYENYFDLNDAKVLSPIANNALAAYKYKLLSSFNDKDDRLVHQIEVIPKNTDDALFSGIIYIADKDWAIYGTDLFTTGKALNISLLDTLRVKQTHIQLENDVWRVFSQHISFNLKILFIKTQGEFVGVYSQYDIEPDFPPGFFNAETFKVEDFANQKWNTFWDSIRPVPLTKEETVEYKSKDSLQQIWKTKAYKDSTDRIKNKPQFINVLTGYTFRNSYRNIRLNIESPIDHIVFNTVQGQTIGLGLSLLKGFDDDYTSWIRLGGNINYGFDDQTVRGLFSIQSRLNSVSRASIRLSGGKQLTQFDQREPIGPVANELYTLWFRQNYAKFYDKQFAAFQYSQHIFNGLFINAKTGYEYRQALINQSPFYFPFFKDRTYFSNLPTDTYQPAQTDSLLFQAHHHLYLDLRAKIQLFQTYVSYPKRRFYQASVWPAIWLRYVKAIPIQTGFTDFDYIECKIIKEDQSIGTIGRLSYVIQGGIFLQKKHIYFPDFHHFRGNRTIFAQAENYLTSFQMLDYYSRSTSMFYLEGHITHHFDGFLWNKIPLLKKLGFEFVTGYHVLYEPTTLPYMEFTLGIDRIGWNLFRFLRTDLVIAYQVGQPIQLGFVMSINFKL